MNIIDALRMDSDYGPTDVHTGGRTVSIMQDSDEILLDETEARQLHDWLGRALQGRDRGDA